MRSLAEFSANSIKGSLNDERLMRRRSWAIPLPRIGHKSVGNETHVNVPVAGFPLFARACLFGHADFRAALPSDELRSAGAAMLRIGGRGVRVSDLSDLAGPCRDFSVNDVKSRN